MSARYAQALFDLANDEGGLDKVAGDLERLDQSIAENADLKRLIHSPIATREQLGEAMTSIAGPLALGETTRKFLGLLAAKRRLDALPAIATAFQDRLADVRGEVKAEVVSASALSDAQVAEVTKAVTEHAGKKVRLVTKVDPSLLGGLIVTVGSHQVDASLKRKLQQLDVVMRGVG